MNEFLVLFADEASAERAGLHPAHLTEAHQLKVIRLVIPFLPWNVIRESVSYAKLEGQMYVQKTVSSQYSKSFLYQVTNHVAGLNLIPVQINQW